MFFKLAESVSWGFLNGHAFMTSEPREILIFLGGGCSDSIDWPSEVFQTVTFLLVVTSWRVLKGYEISFSDAYISNQSKKKYGFYVDVQNCKNHHVYASFHSKIFERP